MNKGKPNDKRVDALYEKLHGPIVRGSFNGTKRHQVQQIVYVEEACRSVIETIDRLAASESPAEAEAAVEEFKSEFHFLRIFKHVAGVTPHQFILRARLREAALRLRTTLDEVLQIALSAGFRDLSNFNHAFRAEFGVSPTVYARRP